MKVIEFHRVWAGFCRDEENRISSITEFTSESRENWLFLFLYHVTYTQGDKEEFTYEEIRKYRKIKQTYTKQKRKNQFSLDSNVNSVILLIQFSSSLQKPAQTL